MSTITSSPALNHPVLANPGGVGIPVVANHPSVRLSEKTIELTFCGQLGAVLGSKVVWIGLTQAQERAHGFDMASQFNGRAILLQFKASNYRPHGVRRFTLSHQQLQKLQQAFAHHPHVTYYVFPDVGNVGELAAVGGDLLPSTWLADVAQLPNPIPASGRAKGNHYADLTPPQVVIHSETSKLPVERADTLAKTLATRGDRMMTSKRLAGLLRELNATFNERRSDLFFRNAAIGVIL